MSEGTAAGRKETESVPPVCLSVLPRPGYLHEHKLVSVREEDDRVLHCVVIVLVLLLAGRALHISELGTEREAQH